ncbi:hypothetical protein BDR26DRAFT_971446 [Obelidium mucronatum]|nr:hypothetical protein BDR26DRAFT_971446 [Obelidium mucronatum]
MPHHHHHHSSTASSFAPVPPAYTSASSIPASVATGSSAPKDKDKDQENSRHVAAVLSQFTGSSEAYGRLVQEKVDLLVVAETALNNASVAELQIAYIAPSCMRIIRCTPASLHHKKISTILHPDDTSLVLAVISAAKTENYKKSVYCRATRMDRLQQIQAGATESTHALLIGRVYIPTPIDTIHTLRIQNLQLKHALTEAVKTRVSNAVSHAPTAEMGRSLAEKSAAAVALLRELDNNPWESSEFASMADLIDNGNNNNNNSSEDKRKGKRRLMDASMQGDDLDQELNSILGLNQMERSNLGAFKQQQVSSSSPTGGGSANQFQTTAQPMSTFDGGVSMTAAVAAGSSQAAVKTAAKKGAKRVKIPQDELYCRQCGSTTSPEWRKGPLGPKTLCNACGLAYSKMQSKQRKLAAKEKEAQAVGGSGLAAAAVSTNSSSGLPPPAAGHHQHHQQQHQPQLLSKGKSGTAGQNASVSADSNDSGSPFPSDGFLAGLEAFEHQFGNSG